jgi:hypothetical protein
MNKLMVKPIRHLEHFIALEEFRRQCMLDADVPALDDLLADDLVYSHSNGMRDDKTSYLDHIAQGHLRYLQVQFKNLQPKILANNVVFVTGEMVATIALLGQPKEMRTTFLTVWSCENDETTWRLHAHQSTPYQA